jgi:hypothetical protein
MKNFIILILLITLMPILTKAERPNGRPMKAEVQNVR